MELTRFKIRNEIQQYLEQNKISPERLSLVNINHWQDIYNRAIDTFVDRRYRYKEELHWISLNGHVREGVERIDFYDTSGHWDWVLHLNEIIPDKKAYLFIEDYYDKMWIYEGCILEIINLLQEEIYDEEYCIIDKKYKWMICFNHHEIASFYGKGLNLKAIKKLNRKEVQKS